MEQKTSFFQHFPGYQTARGQFDRLSISWFESQSLKPEQQFDSAVAGSGTRLPQSGDLLRVSTSCQKPVQ